MTKTKRASAKIPLALNFSKLLASLPAGQTIQDGSVKILDRQEQDVSSTMLVRTTVGADRIDIIVQGGTKGKRYGIWFHVRTQDYEFDEPIELVVS
jgi:hypothetical protein